MKTVIGVALAAVLAISARFAATPNAAAKDAEGKIEISVDDLGKTANLIGRLGKPLGTMVTIKGTWALPRRTVKDYSLRFTVTHVNGMQLAKPVEFNVAQVRVVNGQGENVIPKRQDQKKLDGKTWTLKAYETGEFHITPPEYYSAVGIKPGSFQEPYYFTSPITSEIDGVLQSE